jgi:hypothetical protein
MQKQIVLAAIIVLIIGLIAVASPIAKEGFSATASAPACPTSAQRGPDGSIIVQPMNLTFKTMKDYVAYLAGLYAKGATCLAPMVQPNRMPVHGIIGGQDNQANGLAAATLENATRTVLETDLYNELTSARTPINKLDDYEYSRVFQSEDQRRNKLTSEEKNKLLRSRVLDWANLPFNSEDRSEKEDEFVAGRMESGMREPKSGVFFTSAEGESVMPPDVEAAKLREQKLLATYKPTEISTHVIDNETEAVANLVMKQYASDPNWEPVVTKTGENKWEVTELRPKPRKERYEDGTTINTTLVEGSPLTMPAPSISIDDRNRDDPYFAKDGVVDTDNSRFWNYNDFKKWTPGLERMFAPTADTKAWY